MHAGTIPIPLLGLGMGVDSNIKLFCHKVKKVSAHPKIVRCFQTLSKALVFPLSKRNLCVGAGNFYSSIYASVHVCLRNFSAIHIARANSTVIVSLWPRCPIFPSQNGSILWVGEKIFLLKTKPPIVCQKVNASISRVRRVGRSVW